MKGLLLRSLMDNGRFCWYNALHDKVATQDGEKNIFELVESVSSTQAISTLEKVSATVWPTRAPAQTFYALMLPAYDDLNNVEETASSSDEIPEYCTKTPRLLITPTRCAVVGFSVEMSNRVVRHFISNEHFAPECFLRVTIGEETGARLFSDELSPSLCARVEGLVLLGLSLNGYKYRFLAYSSSQLKEYSLWMVDAEGSWTVDSIRDWMGDFSRCESASKVAARMGQCFSTTLTLNGVSSSPRQRNTVKDDFPDILSIHNGKEMCHSDGTGLIKREVLTSLVAQLPLGPNDPTEVSNIQIRFGGAKGTLTAWDFSRLKLLGHSFPFSESHDVLLRPSMVKFSAPYRQLEVISFSKQIPYYLNRNVVLLLKVHGIHDDIFLQMQRCMLDDLDAMLVDCDKALEMIPRLSGPDSSLSSALVHMLSCGLSPRDEPFLFSCLHAIRAHHLMNLRKKSRIFVANGAVLIGGIDETGLIPEGCVFVQIRPDGGKSLTGFEILNGPVMVTKHPVMHPGDVRMLLAVNIHELRDHKNVVLFSKHGQRPEADKMAGSDLDGDQFAITWDERLFLGEWNQTSCRRTGEWQSNAGETLSLQPGTMIEDSQKLQAANTTPMDFNPDNLQTDPNAAVLEASVLDSVFAKLFGVSREPSTRQGGTVNDRQLMDHFINHAKNDNLGQIASMWLDYANRNGADCGECLKLAALHSIAVDFPKSGKPAIIPKELFISRFTARAHWREKKGSPSYECTGAIGRMYDEVIRRMEGNRIPREHVVPLAGRRFDRHGQILRFLERGFGTSMEDIYKPQIAIRLGLSLGAATDDSSELDLLWEAMDHREEYEQGLLGLMGKYGLQCEGELLTGCIRKYHKLDKKRQHDLSEAVRTQCRELKKNCRQTFFLFVLNHVCPSLELDEDKESSWIECVEAAATGKSVLPEESSASERDLKEFKNVAYQLAAAYYEVTYNSEMYWGNSHQNRGSVLFSFPWIVADVVAGGLRRTE